MSSFHVVQSVLDDLGAAIGLDGMVLNVDGKLALTVGSLEVGMLYESEPADVLWLFSELGAVGDDDEAPMFLLRAGFQSWLAAAMTVAVDRETGVAKAFIGIPVAMLTRDLLQSSLHRFATAALEIRNRLQERRYDALDTSAPNDAPPAAAAGCLRV